MSDAFAAYKTRQHNEQQEAAQGTGEKEKKVRPAILEQGGLGNTSTFRNVPRDTLNERIPASVAPGSTKYRPIYNLVEVPITRNV